MYVMVTQLLISIQFVGYLNFPLLEFCQFGVAVSRSSFEQENEQFWQFSRCSIFCSISHLHLVELSCKTLHLFWIFLNLPTLFLSLLKYLQVGQSGSCPDCRDYIGLFSSLLFSWERDSFDFFTFFKPQISSYCIKTHFFLKICFLSDAARIRKCAKLLCGTGPRK